MRNISTCIILPLIFSLLNPCILTLWVLFWPITFMILWERVQVHFHPDPCTWINIFSWHCSFCEDWTGRDVLENLLRISDVISVWNCISNFTFYYNPALRIQVIKHSKPQDLFHQWSEFGTISVTKKCYEYTILTHWLLNIYFFVYLHSSKIQKTKL